MTERLLFTVLVVSLSTSCVIAALLLLASLLRKRYSAKWRYIAWLVIAVRLLIPLNITLPDAPMNIQIPQQIIRTELTAGALPDIPDLPPDSKEEKTTATSILSFNQILFSVWVVGTVVFLSVQATIYLRFRRKLRYRRPEPMPDQFQVILEQIGAEMSLDSLPGIRVNTGVPTPLLMGLWHPALLLPHMDYTNRELAFILRHELVHFQRRDLWYKLLLLAANAVHWFNPLVYFMVSEAGKDVEMSCDDAVLAGIDSSMRADYCETIIKTLPIKGWGAGFALTTSFGSMKGNTKMRIKNLFDHSTKRSGGVSFCAMILITGLIGGLVAYTPVSAAASSQTSASIDAPQIALPTDPRLKLVEREFTTAELTSQGISGIEVVVPTENVLITRGGNTLKFSYYQFSDSEYDFTTVTDGGGTRTYWALLRMVEGSADDPLRTVHIMLPQDFDFKTIIVDTGSGDISLNNCSTNGVGIHTRSQSGNISLVNCSTGILLASSVNGDITIQNILIGSWGSIYSDTGDVLFQPQDSISNFHLDFNTKSTNTITVNGKKYTGGIFELNENASKHISIESGYIENRNKKIDENGQGTASFTIKDQ